MTPAEKRAARRRKKRLEEQKRRLHESEQRHLQRERRKENNQGPSEDDVLWALGCELWTVSHELQIASSSLISGELGGPSWGRRSLQAWWEPQPGGFTSHLPTVLSNSGEALRLAAESLLDAEWEGAWRGLELASRTCQEYLPSASFDGLIDLVFAHAEVSPGVGARDAAAASLLRLASGLDEVASRVEENDDLQYPHRERASLVVQNAAEVLRQAVDLMEPGTFYWPMDPRELSAQANFRPDSGESDDFGDYDEDEDEYYYVDEDGLDPPLRSSAGYGAHPRGRAKSGKDGGQAFDATARIRALREELKASSGEGRNARRRVLKRYLRENHPDHNPGLEAEVQPVFLYVLRMLRVEEGGRRIRRASEVD